MATTLATNDILALRAWVQLGEQGAVNTYNFQVISTAGTSATEVDMGVTFDVLMSGFYGGGCANSVVYRGLQLYFVKRTGPLPAPAVNTTSAGNCTGGTNALPRNTCPILKYNGFARGPSGRGRLYIPFFPTTVMQANGEITSGGNTYLNTWGTALLTPFVIGSGGNTATVAWGLLKRKPAISFQQMLAAGSAGKFGQMHKRGDYGRPNNSPV